MKKILWFLPLTITLYGCPFESNVPMAPAPTEPVDSNLIGYWYGIIKYFSDMFGIEALEITQKSDSVYAITRYGKAIKEDMILPDTAYFTGYTSYIGEQRYMNIEGTIVTVTPQRKKPPIIKKETVFYIAAIQRSNDTLTVKTITESFSTRKKFNSPDELKQLVTDFSALKQSIYDDQYSLSYRKIQKPQPVRPN